MSEDPAERLWTMAQKAIKDAKDMRKDPARRALREVMIQIDSLEPNMEAVRENFPVALEKYGSDVLFRRDEHTMLSLKDVLEANKTRAVAKPAVEYVSQTLASEMKRENKYASEAMRRNRERSETMFKG